MVGRRPSYPLTTTFPEVRSSDCRLTPRLEGCPKSTSLKSKEVEDTDVVATVGVEVEVGVAVVAVVVFAVEVGGGVEGSTGEDEEVVGADIVVVMIAEVVVDCSVVLGVRMEVGGVVGSKSSRHAGRLESINRMATRTPVFFMIYHACGQWYVVTDYSTLKLRKQVKRENTKHEI